MLEDKDVTAVLGLLRHRVDHWFAASTDGARGLSDAALAGRARPIGIEMTPGGPVSEAMRRATSVSRSGDRILVFGSFHTVGPALACV